MTIEIIEDVPYIFIEKLHEDKVLCLNINGELIKTFKLAKLTSFTICSYDGTMYYYIYKLEYQVVKMVIYNVMIY